MKNKLGRRLSTMLATRAVFLFFFSTSFVAHDLFSNCDSCNTYAVWLFQLGTGAPFRLTSVFFYYFSCATERYPIYIYIPIVCVCAHYQNTCISYSVFVHLRCIVALRRKLFPILTIGSSSYVVLYCSTVYTSLT